MVSIQNKNAKLFLFIVLPLVIAAISMLTNNYMMLRRVADSVNERERDRAYQAAVSAFAAANERLNGTMIDNAFWDDAVTQTAGRIDPEWMNLTWGVGTLNGNYDIVYVLDADGHRKAAYRSGEIEFEEPETNFGPSLRKLLNELPDGRHEAVALDALMQTRFGLASVAIAPIVPSSEKIAMPIGRPNILLFARYMSPEIINHMSGQFIVSGLALEDHRGVHAELGQLMDRWNNRVSTLYWLPSNPGEAAKKSYANSALFATLALIAAMLPVTAFLGNMLNRHERKEAEARASARLDPLSSLPNRLHLSEHLEASLKEFGSNVALAFIDLDGFKFVNDTYDHSVGDKVIQAVAKGIAACVQKDAFLARLGGDEFALVVTGSGATDKSKEIASRIAEFVSSPLEIESRSISIGASIGIADTAESVIEPAELMRRADIAMYAAKQTGRNRFCQFHPTLDEKRITSAEIAERLHSLMNRQRFDHAFQPIVTSGTRNISRLEVLARWPEGEGMIYSPDKFIPVAEQCGLINQLGSLLLCRAMTELAPHKNIGLSYNLSPTQLVDRNLPANMKAIAERHQFDLSRLEVEITETVLIKQPDVAKVAIGELRKLGIRIALDDFGTGFASIGYLRQFHFDVIKLDRSLTQKIATDTGVQNIVLGTVLIARSLSANIVAEGIETADEAKLLELAGCNFLQGYFFGKPQKLSTLLSDPSASVKTRGSTAA